MTPRPSLADLDDETRTIAGSLRRRDAQRGDRGGGLARRLGGELRPARGDRHLGLIERQRERRQRLLVEVVLLRPRDGLAQDAVRLRLQLVVLLDRRRAARRQ